MISVKSRGRPKAWCNTTDTGDGLTLLTLLTTLLTNITRAALRCQGLYVQGKCPLRFKQAALYWGSPLCIPQHVTGKNCALPCVDLLQMYNRRRPRHLTLSRE